MLSTSRRIALRLVLAGIGLSLMPLSGASAAEPATLRLWPGQAPGEAAPLAKAEGDIPDAPGTKSDIRRLTNVSEPVLAVFPAPKEKATGASIIIAPGGAYQFLSWTHEGTELAERFNRDGVTAFVLKYRVPKRETDPDFKLPLMDAQRAVSLVRSRAAEWNIDPQRIGFLGISAGGHLAVNAISRSLESPPQRAYPAADAVDLVSFRPNFCVLLYPGSLLDKTDPTRLAPEVKVTKDTPPTFLAVAGNDAHCAECSARYYLELKRAGVPAELHVYASGGHGFGMRPRAGVAATWPDRCVDWMRSTGLLKAQ